MLETKRIAWAALHEATVRQILDGRLNANRAGWQCGCRPDPPEDEDSQNLRLCAYHLGFDTGYELGEALAEMRCRDEQAADSV